MASENQFSFSDDLCRHAQILITQNVRGDQVQTQAGRWVSLTGPVGSQRMLDLLYVQSRRDEVAALKRASPTAFRDVCPEGHTSPPSWYCPPRHGHADDPGGWTNGRRCATCVSSRWERIIYALVQMLGFTVKKHHVEGYEIDIYVPELRRGIEYNGRQHYERGFFTRDLTQRLLTDQNRLFACMGAGIDLLFVRYDDKQPVETVLNFLLKK